MGLHILRVVAELPIRRRNILYEVDAIKSTA